MDKRKLFPDAKGDHDWQDSDGVLERIWQINYILFLLTIL